MEVFGMGISCKPIGKLKSNHVKLENAIAKANARVRLSGRKNDSDSSKTADTGKR